MSHFSLSAIRKTVLVFFGALVLPLATLVPAAVHAQATGGNTNNCVCGRSAEAATGCVCSNGTRQSSPSGVDTCVACQSACGDMAGGFHMQSFNGAGSCSGSRSGPDYSYQATRAACESHCTSLGSGYTMTDYTLDGGAAGQNAGAGATGRSGSGSGSPIALTNPLRAQSLPEVVGTVIRTVLGIAGSLALLMFVYGGVVWITAGGNEKRVGEAKEILKNAAIGLALLFFAYTVIGAFFAAVLSP